MRGLLSFVLVVLLVESILLMYNAYLLHTKDNYDREQQMYTLQLLYHDKMAIKRKIQNVLAEPTTSTNPFDKIEEASARLEQLEIEIESTSGDRVDLWCGYVNNEVLDELLASFKQGDAHKPLSVFDASTKIFIPTEDGVKEVHACSTVLVYDFDNNMVRVGRNYAQGFNSSDISLLKPVIGITISENGIYDVDYIDVI